MSILLTILTPTIRPAGALEVARSIQAAHPHDLEIRHVIAYWPGAPAQDHTQLAPWLTRLIAMAAHGWLLGVDDDNRLHPDLPRRLAELIAEHPDARAFVFDCAYPGRHQDVIRAAPAMMRPGSIDGGQVVLHTDVARSLQWPGVDCGDGHYLAALYRANVSRFVFVGETLTYHNHQVWA